MKSASLFRIVFHITSAPVASRFHSHRLGLRCKCAARDNCKIGMGNIVGATRVKFRVRRADDNAIKSVRNRQNGVSGCSLVAREHLRYLVDREL